ncbi:MAG: sulfoxide reductase heme-binding subunit YedZ [Myxococcota bacterium]|nr:sulfoxide reductase heme-binding subunit YedZ [Myxococcota bacterium]
MKLGDKPVRIGVAIAGLLPGAALAAAAVNDRLGADPVEAILHESGEWALRFLLLSLCMTPLQRWLGAPGLIRHRRTLGLLAFGYASIHFSIYLSLDLGFDPGALVEDLLERPFIAVGFAALLALTPLALTSSRRAIRKLGKRWQSLHRLAYLALVLAAIHFLWSAKADLLEPGIYAGFAALLLALRVVGRPGRKSADYARLARAEARPGSDQP